MQLRGTRTERHTSSFTGNYAQEPDTEQMISIHRFNINDVMGTYTHVGLPLAIKRNLFRPILIEAGFNQAHYIKRSVVYKAQIFIYTYKYGNISY